MFKELLAVFFKLLLFSSGFFSAIFEFRLELEVLGGFALS